jgi:hypothetical protein
VLWKKVNNYTKIWEQAINGIIYIETKEFVKIKKMQKLTNKEEEIMQILWKLKKLCKAVG